MAGSPTLHIKDSYYFEVPKFLWRSPYTSKNEFPWVWVKNDPQYQDWEAHRIYAELSGLGTLTDLPAEPALIDAYQQWRDHDHANFGKPLDVYLETHESWFQSRLEDKAFRDQWNAAKKRATGSQAFEDFKKDTSITWSPEKIAGYNQKLSGKILIPQPFGELRNMYEKESGFCISRYMVIEAAVFVILTIIFSRIARKISTGEAPKGRVWNLIESLLLFIRDEVARKAIHDDHGHGHDDHAGHGHSHDAHGHAVHAHGGSAHHGAVELKPHAADRFVPLLWTFFFFIMGCNLMGMLPWVGAPTSSFGVTAALALGVVASSILFGMQKFGVVGFWLNQIPGMDLPAVMAVFLKPFIFVIEVFGFFIKHGVLAVRLLANMVAGHLVLFAIMDMAFSETGAASSYWPLTAVISILASTAFSCLELFVALLQAYVFTFLSALFIGAATSRH